MLALVRTVHTIIYVVMAAATVYILYCGLAGVWGPMLNYALVLVTLESAVFVSYGMKCPLTTLARKYGAEKGYVFDTFLPERATRYTFRFFGSMLGVGLLLLVLRYFRVL